MLSTVCATFLIHFLGYILVLATLAILGVPLVWSMLPAALYFVLLALLLTTGLSLIVSSLRVFLKDFQHAIPLLLTLWFFATPVLYSPSLIPETVRPYIELNPMAYIIMNIRDTVLFGHWAPTAIDGLAFLATVAVLYVGYWFFRRCSPRFEDFL